MLENVQNYYYFAPLADHKMPVVNVSDINLTNWLEYYNGLVNVMKDGIELPEVHKAFIKFIFPNGMDVELSIPDTFVNLILWYSIIALHKPIEPKHLWFGTTFTADDVKDYIDQFVIDPNRMTVPNRTLNNVIADTITRFVDIDKFSMYLSSTLNLEDSIDLMQACPEYYDLMHCDLSRVPIEKVKDEGMEIVYKAIDIIKNSKKYIGYDHCLKDSFEAKEGINVRQYKENSFNIGTKPDGQGSIYHDIVNSSYITGGLNNLVYQFIDSGASRVAQIISKKNVGESGGFSRILGLNNINTYLNPDPTYDCHTRNLLHITIHNKQELDRFKYRYYRLHPEGQEFRINPGDTSLIGKEIYLRSPMTCASHAAGHGICYRCYGDIAYTNADICVGRYATEDITAQYTQKRLSAKHLLETLISLILWNQAFRKFFSVDVNVIKLNPDVAPEAWEGYKLEIDPESIQLENDDEFLQHKFFSEDNHSMEDEGPFYNEYVTEFKVIDPEGNEFLIGSDATEESPEAKMYFSNDFANIIREVIKKNIAEENDEEHIVIPMNLLEDTQLFFTKIQNNDLGKNLDIFNDLINKKAITKSYTKDTLLEKLLETVIKGGIKCQSVHLEVILSNQIRSVHDRLKTCNWMNPNEEYELLTLNEALTDNPSIIISLVYQKLGRTLFNPSSFKKTAPSIFDLFFMRKPKKFLNADHEIWDESNKPLIKPGECPIMWVKDPKSMPRPKDARAYINSLKPRPKTEIDD